MLSRRMLIAALGASMLLLAAQSALAAGKIEAGSPAASNKPQDAWKGRARIVGSAANAPAFTAAVLDSAGKQVKSVSVKEGSRAYEVEWLEPGVYTLRVAAEGFDALTLGKLEVRANQDLRIDLTFSR